MIDVMSGVHEERGVVMIEENEVLEKRSMTVGNYKKHEIQVDRIVL